ncbi:TerB family tellurite resistance protein [Anabaena sp. UHCC 0253]|uniref:tellurite resistance TerB family protein n=1 Tax=Anabaena sp. UHCC 0253 TaxID=2590019 RepID=UPI0014472907|nr:TerB family tellurite resistance protein [Anabaena sp. UHCC 0253]MTJ54665.1 TerB family tellurite resistance protein [Anabaena sp. UHCC 0253]
MPVILPFILQTVLPVLSTIFALLVPVLSAVLSFTITRIPKIPSYIRLILILYSDIDSSAKERKMLNGGLLVISSILTFMAYNLIPWTGIPLIGAITTPIAASLSIVVTLVLLDGVFNLNKGYYIHKLQERNFAGISDIETDINDLKTIFGKSWQKLTDTINNASQKIYEEGNKQGINFNDKSFQGYVNHELEGLKLYFNNKSVTYSLDPTVDLLKDNNSDDWTKEALSFGTSATIGTVAGVGASTAASSVFVHASLLTTIQGIFGMSTGGIVVGAFQYSLFTVAAPVGVGLLATVGIYSGLMNWKNKDEAAKMSKFISEIMIAALPMAWIDGKLAEEEEDAIDRLMTTSGIRKQERDLVRKAIDKRQKFENIIQTSILFDEEHRDKTCRLSNNERLKHRLMLSVAWEIAIADGKIEFSELKLHNRMADKLGISREEVKEIRRVINLKHHQEILVSEEIIEANVANQKLLIPVREVYLLKAAENL